MRKTSLLADITLLFVALIWGTTFVVVQNAIAFLEPITFNAVRFSIATILLLSWLLIFQRNQLKTCSYKLIIAGILIGFWLFVGYATQTLGLLFTTSSKAGFITGLSVVLVPLLSFILFKYKPSKGAVLGILIATIGLYLLTMTDSVSLNVGDGLVFICAIGFALQIVYTGKYSSKFPTLLLTIVQIATVTILSIIGAFLFEDWQLALEPSIIFDNEVIVALFITSVFATALAFLAQTAVQKFTTSTRVALIFAMEPVFAAITGYIGANDRLSYSAIVGCVLIFAGMIFAELPVKRLSFRFKQDPKDSKKSAM
ncbi:DMT family transporter [Niallia sp. Krafla_26]|uniref:DMT family transporter n=1 Tax=Niallia sp. Krafla_26 TaxID=3064703 RepID=UPI003D167D15